MKGATTLQRLGVMPSFSRPSVSNDNPYSESLFKTLNITLAFLTSPLAASRRRGNGLLGSSIGITRFTAIVPLKFVTPGQRHRGENVAILHQRSSLYEATRVQRPERWFGSTRNWKHEGIVFLNPSKSTEKEVHLKEKVA